MPDDPRKPVEKVGIVGDIRIETAYFFPSSDLTQEQVAHQQKNTKNGGEPSNLCDQTPEAVQEPQKILEPSPGINLNPNISTHATTLSSCQEHLAQVKVSLHRIYRSTSGTTSQVSKSDLRNLINLLSNADELINQVWQEMCEEEDGYEP